MCWPGVVILVSGSGSGITVNHIVLTHSDAEDYFHLSICTVICGCALGVCLIKI